MKLTAEQLGAVRPIVVRLANQGPEEGSTSTDGAITLENSEAFPGASRVHVWQFTRPIIGRRILVDVVGLDHTVTTIRLKPQEIFKSK